MGLVAAEPCRDDEVEADLYATKLMECSGVGVDPGATDVVLLSILMLERLNRTWACSTNCVNGGVSGVAKFNHQTTRYGAGSSQSTFAVNDNLSALSEEASEATPRTPPSSFKLVIRDVSVTDRQVVPL